jgi:periplasmic mercuric ion binding protein
MKTIKFFTLTVTVMAMASCNSNETKNETTNSTVTEVVNGVTTSTFKVWGNCEMCKETIEGSLKVTGVSKADWNVDTKMMTVSYDSSRISLDQIQKNIAGVGYDTEKYKGDDKAYHELAECCQYERK